MRILLDTVSFLWIIAGSEELPDSARAQFQFPGNDIYLSAVSAWEITIKNALGKLPLPAPPGELIPDLREKHAIEPLPLDEESALHLDRLPPIHRDPFDRMLICQAIAHGLALLTPDDMVRAYPVRTLW